MLKFKNNLAKNMFGKTATECEDQKICVSCHKSITKFSDALSVKEYNISGLCQECQDSVFGA